MSKIVFPLVLLFLSVLCIDANSQEIITTESGKKLILNADGTWTEYVEEAAPVEEVQISPADVVLEAQYTSTDAEENDYEKIKTEIRQRVEAVKQKSASNKLELSKIKTEIEIAKKAKSLKIDLKALEKRKLELYLQEYDLEQEMNKIKPLEYTLNSLEDKPFDKEKYQNLKKMYAEYMGIEYIEEELLVESVTEEPNSAIAEETELVVFEETKIKEEVEAPPPPQKSLSEKQKELMKYGFQVDERDVLREPVKDDCKVAKQGIDQSTRNPKIEMESSFLFGYTHPNIKSFFKEKDYLNCEARLSKSRGLYFLTLDIRIASIKANKTYGSLDKGSVVRLKLINDETIVLHNITQSTGILEPLTGVTVYQANYPMEKGEYKKISKSELDKLGLIWSSGYEEYEIYEVDFLMNQAECLNSL